LTTQKFLLGFPKFEVGHIHSQARCGTAAGFIDFGYPHDLFAAVTVGRGSREGPDQSISRRCSFETWAARMIAAADEFQRNKRPDPLGGFVLR